MAMHYHQHHSSTTLNTKTTTNTNMSRDSSFQSLPLRVSSDQIASIINPIQTNENSNTPRLLRCTHYDAIRFFTPSSLPLNVIKPLPTRATTDKFDQPGCIHVNMDLFKYVIILSFYL